MSIHRRRASRYIAGVNAEVFHDFVVGQRVMTVDGIPGVVVGVIDGPTAGNEAYDVVLDDDLGGGQYASRDLSALEEVTAAGGGQTVPVVVPQPVDDPTLHLASEDYPELAEILVERPPLAHSEPLRMSAAKTSAFHPSGLVQVVPEGQPREWVPGGYGGNPDASYSWTYTAADGTVFYLRDTLDRGIQAWTSPPSEAGHLTWMNDGSIFEVAVRARHQRKGLATAMLTMARTLYPEDNIHHSDVLTDDGRAWSQAVAAQQYAPEGPCPACGGTAEDAEGHECTVCDGSGYPTLRDLQDAGIAATAAVPLECGDCGETYFTDGEPHGCVHPEVREAAAQQVMFATSALWDYVLDKATQYLDDKVPGIETGQVWSMDWCRFRKNRTCFYPKEMDLAATQQAGYAVWVPYNRGVCWRDKWDDQKDCPVAEPGPNSGDPRARIDATTPWSEGGQRAASKADGDHLFEFTAAWSDVRAKASAIRRSGGVKVISIVGDKASGRIVTAEVRGDNNVYEASIQSEPGRTNVALWTCACPWAAYSWGRSGRWKKYEGRMCSHALALTYEAQSKNLMEVTETPDWGEGVTVMRPGDYQPPPKKVAMRPASVDPDLAVAPAVLIAHQMLASGDPERLVAQAFGEGIVAQAKVLDFAGRLQALVRGTLKSIKRIFTDSGTVELTDGSVVPVRDIEYPTFHPTKGLERRARLIEAEAFWDEGEDDSGDDVEDKPRYWPTSESDMGTADYGDQEVPGGLPGCEVCGAPATWAVASHYVCPVHKAWADSLRAAAELHEEPEPALPSTTGEEGPEDDDADDQDDEDAADDEDAPPVAEDDAQDRPDGQALTSESSIVAGPANPGLVWLAGGGSGGDADVAQAAQAFLAKQAVKTFSPAEQAAIINEGEDVTAANLDALDLSGTHYLALEEALASAEDDEDWLG